MKEKKKTEIGKIRIAIAVLFILGIVVIGFYPLPAQDLTLKIVTDGAALDKHITSEEAAAQAVSLEFAGRDELAVQEVQLYRSFKSICLQKIRFSELVGLMNWDASSPMEMKDNQLVLKDNGSVRIVLNDAGQQVLKEMSSSLWLERILLAELLLVLCAAALIVCAVVEEKMIEDNRSTRGPVYEAKKFFADLKKYKEYMIFAAKADLNAEVANSYLNRLWWLLEPFFSMLVYVIVFGRVMGNSIENYAVFVFSGLLMWNFFSKSINNSVKLVRNNRDIVTRVYVPKFVLLLTDMILNFFKLLFSLVILIPMLLVFRVPIGLNILWVIPAFGLMLLLSFGAGMILLHFGVYVDDLSYAVGILLQMMMFLSGVFYDVITSLAAPLNMIMISLNPAAVFINTMRNALVYNTAANLPILAIWYLIAIILCCVGVHIVYKNENSYVKVV